MKSDAAQNSVLMDEQNRSYYTAGVNLNYRNNANDLWDLLQKQGQLQEKIGSATFTFHSERELWIHWSHFVIILNGSSQKRLFIASSFS